jgi:hypothetical protein
MSRGFDAAREPQVAVCLLPGTELAFAREVEYERYFIFWARPDRRKGRPVYARERF